MKKTISVILLLLCLFAASAGNLLKNYGFSSADGKISNWKIIPAALGTFAGDSAVLKPIGKGMPELGITDWVRLKADEQFVFTADVQGDEQTRFHFAVRLKNGNAVKRITSRWFGGDGGKSRLCRYEFTTPKEGVTYVKVSVVAAGNGQVKITALALTAASEASPVGNHFIDSEFQELRKDGTMPLKWGISRKGAGRRIENPDHPGSYAVEMNNPAGGTLWSLNWDVNPRVAAGRNYIFSVFIKADLRSSYCIETTIHMPTPPNRTISSNWRKGTGKWEKVSLPFRWDELPASPVFVILLRAPGKLLFASPSLVENDAVFANGDFSGGWNRWERRSGSADLVDSGNLMGNSLRLHADSGTASVVQKRIRLQKNTNYLLRYKVRGGSGAAGNDISATLFRVSMQKNGICLSGTEKWWDAMSSWWSRRMSFFVHEDMIADMVCELRGPGEAVFDNIELIALREMPKKLEIRFDMPFAFRNCAWPVHKDIAELTGTLICGDSEGYTAELTLDGRKKMIALGNEENRFSISRPFSPGIYPLNAVLRNRKGEVIGRETVDFTVRSPNNPRYVCFRDDGILLVGGHPFFPLGSWGVKGGLTEDEKAALLKENGFNTWMSPPDLYSLDLRAEHQLASIVSVGAPVPPRRQVEREVWKERMGKHFAGLSAHDSLIGYFTVDEPSAAGVTPERLMESYRLLAEFAPEHPAQMNEEPRGEINDLRAFLPGCDIYGVDIYPVPAPGSHSALRDKTVSCVGKYTDRCREIVYRNKPIWMTLQGFAWGVFSKRKAIYPTHEENRFMAYNAITHGASGLFWWGLGEGGHNPKFIATLGKTLKELNAMTSVLVCRNVKDSPVRCNRREIRLLHKKGAGVDCVIAVNESPDTVNAEISGFPYPYVLFENRRRENAGASFSDSFGPYEVHVYSRYRTLPPPVSLPAMKKRLEKLDVTSDYRHGNWIWYPGRSRVTGDIAYFSRTFHLDKPLEKAEFMITADDYYQWALNGKRMPEKNMFRTWNIIEHHDITSCLRSGENHLTVKGVDGGSAPCGIYFVMKLSFADGSTRLIISDSSVQVSRDGKSGWLPAEILGPYGISPWHDMLVRPHLPEADIRN